MVQRAQAALVAPTNRDFASLRDRSKVMRPCFGHPRWVMSLCFVTARSLGKIAPNLQFDIDVELDVF